MPTLAFAGGEIGTMAELALPSGIAMETAIVHAGKYAYRVSAAGTGTLAFAPQTLVYFRGYFQYPAGLAANSVILDVKTSGAVSLFTVRLLSASGFLRITLNSVNFNSSTPVVPDVWHRLELRIDQVAGTVELCLDGRPEFIATGPIATPPGQIAITSTSGTTYWDDLHIATDNWIGPGYVMARQGAPGTPTYNGFTKTGGAIDVVWSETPSGAVNFAASTAVSQTQTMLVEKIKQVARGGKNGTLRVRANDTVLAAQVLCIAKRVGAGTDHYISRVVNGELTNTPIGTTTTDALYSSGIFTAYHEVIDGAVGYTAMEIGAARGQGTSNLTVEDVWLMLAVATGEYPRVHLTGLETGSIQEVGVTAGTVAVSSALAKTGTYALRLTGAAASAALIPGAVDVLDHPRLYVRAWLNHPVLPAAEEAVLSLRSAQGTVVECRITPAGAVRLYVLGVQRGADVAGAFVAGGWTCVELFSRSPGFSPINYMLNSNVEAWDAGTTVPPTNYFVYGTGATVAKDTVNFKLGTASAELSAGAAADCGVFQNIITAWPPVAAWVGRVMYGGAWVRATVPNRAYVWISDGVNNRNSAMHSGNGQWEWLTAGPMIFAANGTGPQLVGSILAGAPMTAQFDGFVLTTDAAPSDWFPYRAADGEAGIQVNGRTVIAYAGDTGYAPVQAVVSVLTNVGLVLYADDISVADIGWIGPGRIVARQGIAGAPGSDAWTKVGGAIEAVWSNTPTNPATYAESAAISTAQEMQVAASGLAPSDIVLGARLAAFCRLAAAGVGGPHRLRYRRAGSTTPTNQNLPLASTTTALFLGNIFTLTPASLSGLQIGGAIGGEAPHMRIEDLWLMIEYASLTLAPLPPVPPVPPSPTGLLLELDI